MRRRRRTKNHDWAPYRDAERPVREFARHGARRLALAYANVYAVGMSSLGFQRTYELVHDHPEWVAERFFSDGAGMPRSVETGAALSDFACVAFSVSFEEDYVELLRLLDRAAIPLRREAREPWHPLVVMGGSCAAINPLPMAGFVDVFALGAAENLLPALLGALAEEEDKTAVLERLAAAPGFFVPAHHRPEDDDALPKLKKLELSAEQLRQPGHLPSSCIVTPRTEFADKYLIEMSRGCPEKCKYCWATFGMGSFRYHPTDYILASLERARAVTDQVGFVATAVGDHPQIARILRQACARGFRSSVSSIRIPAVREETLEPLYASGARSITLAPETGSDRLRFLMNKPIPNELLLDKVRLIFRQGFTQLKLYFILGLPEETPEDVHAILELAARCRQLMLEEARKSGVVGNVHLGTNLLIPKPYTPWQRQPLDDERSLKAKLSLLKRGVAQLPNVTLSTMSVRQAVWQTYLSRAGRDAADALERVARGQHVASILRDFADRIHPEVFKPQPRRLRWHFMRMG
ncbi:MAG: radical SAM protein [Acidobacteria bacterium]|nr:MAG: radical SAM protein [Acidobacteriota bacterium]